MDFLKFIVIVLSICVLSIFAGVTYIMSKREDRKGMGLSIFILVSQVLQLLYLLS